MIEFKDTANWLKEAIANIPADQKASFELSYDVADRLDDVLKKQGMTPHELARRLGKRDSEISKWLTGRHNFTLSTIASIEVALGVKIVTVM